MSKSILIEYKDQLDYSDVFIVPQFSNVTTRQDVDISSTFSMFNDFPVITDKNKYKINIPVISANMDTITGKTMCQEMWKNGALGAMHRFMSIEDNVKEVSMLKGCGEDKNHHCVFFASVGVNNDSKERAEKIAKFMPYPCFVIDIAHGDSQNMKEMLSWMRKTFPKAHIMAGNVATPDAVKRLESWGADSIKVGIGPGAVCLTKNVTGVTFPQFSAVVNCAAVSSVPIVADGGIKEIGEIAKAIGAGASLVMCGGLFAGADECPGQVMEGKMIYRGMASRDAMLTIRSDEETLPTPEGKTTTVNLKGPVSRIIKDIAGGLRSAFSYTNARTLKEFQEKVVFGTRKQR